MIDLKQVPESKRGDLAFQLVVALRDTVNIAKKKGNKATYENAIQLFYDFSPELYGDIVTSLPQRNLSDEAKLFLAKAQALSMASPVTALELLEAEVNEIKGILTYTEGLTSEQRRILRSRVGSLESLRKSLKPRTLSEHRILIRDASKADREDFGAKFISTNDYYIDYKLDEKKFLRIRLLHPDTPEHLTGADLIYEQHDEETGKIRILFLQYKIWENGVLYFSQTKNLDKQLEKLEKCLCQNRFCDSPQNPDGIAEYRFPYCSAFLRPTDKLQNQNEKLVSSGIHIPVCSILRFMRAGNEKLERKKIRFETLNHEIFEQLFNRGFIGSQWLNESEVESFYRENKILENDESIIFYAREIKDKTSDAPYSEVDV